MGSKDLLFRVNTVFEQEGESIMGASQSTMNTANQAGSNSASLQIYLGAQPRLLRDMLHLALSQLLGHAEIITLESQDYPLGRNTSAPEGAGTLWWITTTENGGNIDKQIQSAFSQSSELCIAALGQDARSLHVYALNDDGKVDETTYTDFSLAQLIDILRQGHAQGDR